MVDALIVSNVLLWVLVLVLAALVLALARQIGVLHERVAPAGALLGSSGPRVGEAAPVVEAEDWSGLGVSVGARDPDGVSTLLFFLSPTCPVCKSLVPVVRSLRRAARDGLRVVWASDGPRDEHVDFVGTWGFERERYVLSTPLGIAYRVDKLPHAVLIDSDGVIRAKGLVNTREHLESLFEARDLGVASVQELLAGQDGRRVA